jgi:hypothetical protein
MVVVFPLRAAERDELPGYVDGSQFLDLATEDTTSVEVNFHGSLLKAILSIDPELKKVAGGLESLHAVILTFSEEGQAAKAFDLLQKTEERLIARDWEALTRIKNGSDRVTVLVLSDEDQIQGLVVMVAGAEDGEVVFANIAGTIDLAAIAQLGETFDIPGLADVNK